MEPSYINQSQATASAIPVQPVSSSSSTASRAMSAGIFGFVVVSTGVMGANLNKVTKGEMSVGQALGDSVVKGASGGVAAASAAAATNTLTSGGLVGLAVTLATATGVSYLINRVKPQ